MSSQRNEDDPESNDLKKWEIMNRTWDPYEVNEKGELVQLINTENWQSETNRRKLALRNKSRGLIRSIVIVLDLSDIGLNSRDFGCSRIQLYKQALRTFIINFFEQNPISQISIVSASNGKAQILTYLCGSADVHLNCIEHLDDYSEEGVPSIHNAMNVSLALLKSAAKYSTKEVMMIYGSLHSCDITPIDPIIKKLCTNNVIVSVIGFGASVFILRRLSIETGGTYLVPLNSDHFNDILKANIEPPEWSSKFQRLEFIPFGFVYNKDDNIPSFDVSELRSQNDALPKYDGLSCPNCNFRVFAVPVYCPSCGILLLTPDNISRTKFQLVALPPFQKVEPNNQSELMVCSTCCMREKEMFMCPKCQAICCSKCNKFIHEILNRCPSCALLNIV
ncbi:General transcription factor IIH subunit 2 [Tritrichomonas musculus]|uniref:General transcription factor IIH subunit 2 n=1 Tax=Tritrichomonas musculus TaxID=1915356 RepID=A0ABR2IR36_9EUKA